MSYGNPPKRWATRGYGDAMKYCRQLLELGVLANDSYGHTIRMSPPLILTDDEIDYVCERLEKVLVG